MKLRTIGMTVVAALALVAGRAQAQEAGWDTKYGVLFTIPNLFAAATSTPGADGGDRSIINDYNGLVGFQYNLGAQTALRLSADLLRRSEGITETKNDLTGTTTKILPGETSAYGVTLVGEYLMRMSTASVAPYAGAGAFISFFQSNRNGKNEVPGTVTEYDSYDRTTGIGLLAKIGLEWRVHKVISLYAEYQADLTLAEGTSSQDNVKVNGTQTVKSTSKEAHFFQLATGIANGGKLGLIAYF